MQFTTIMARRAVAVALLLSLQSFAAAQGESHDIVWYCTGWWAGTESSYARWSALAHCVMASQLTVLQYRVVVIDVVCGQTLAGNHLAIPEKDQYSIRRQIFISQFLYYNNMNL